jgi:TadE-like protein
MAARSRSLARLFGKRGTAAIEYAIIVPTFLFCTLAILDTARLFWTSATINRAVTSAARCAGIGTSDCLTVAQVALKVVQGAWNLDLDSNAITVAKQDCGIRITATYDFSFSVPGFSTIPISYSTCYATSSPQAQ